MRRCRRTLLAGFLALSGALFVRPGLAQQPDELALGRQLFAAALEDEEHHRFAQALEKYKLVLRIRDTAAIRYRMGSTLEGLGKITQAVDAYAAAVRIGSPNAADADVVKASQARIDALEPKVAHLALEVPAGAPADTEIRVDDEPVAPEARADVRVDPGPHVITATTKSARPFRAQVTLSEGGRAQLPIVLEPTPPPPPPPPSSSLRTVGIVTGAVGGVLVLGGVVVLALRSGEISELKESCPQGNCPVAREQELRAARDRAVIEGPLGVALIATGAAAVGTGIVFFAIGGREAKTATRLVPSTMGHAAGIRLVKDF